MNKLHTSERTFYGWTAVVLTLLLVALGAFNVSQAQAAGVYDADLNFVPPTTRTDGSPFDAVAELQRFSFGCGRSQLGPYDVVTADLPHAAGATVPSTVTLPLADGGVYYCVGWAVDTDNLVSPMSNVAELQWRAPPGPLQDLQKACYGNCSVQININYNPNGQ